MLSIKPSTLDGTFECMTSSSSHHDETMPWTSRKSRHDNTKTIASPIATWLKTSAVRTIGFHPAARKAAASQDTAQRRRSLCSFSSVVLPWVAERRGGHVFAPEGRTPLPDIPSHVVASVRRGSFGKQTHSTGLIQTCFL
jgi:hypothetical protein